MDTKISYAGILRRALASVIDGVLWMIIASVLISSLFLFSLLSYDADNIYITITYIITLAIILLISYIICNILMITRFSGTPGKLLCGVYVKDANTLKNVTLAQATIRCILSGVLWCILSSPQAFGWISILPILVVLFAVFDHRKQTVYDKIAKTVVIDYKPS